MENQSQKQHIDTETIGKGTLLLSSPLLSDPNFKRSVVLILERDGNNGHFGLILNRPLDLSLEDICDMPGDGSRMQVFSGGPVDLQRMFWLHTFGDRLPGSIEILPGLYVGGDYDTLIQAFSNGRSMEGHIRFYLGYSGWTSGQLNKEVEAGAWGLLPHPLDPKALIELQGEEMWYSLVRQLGSSYRHWLMLPSDPAMN